MPFTVRRLISGIIIFVMTSTYAFSTPRPVHAAVSITVNTFVDNGNAGCSLRDAIISVNTKTAHSGCPKGSGSGDVIYLEIGEYILDIPGGGLENDTSKGDLDILVGVTIIGKGPGTIIRAQPVLNDRIFQIKSAIPVTISNLTIRGGNPGSYSRRGGGILNDTGSTLVLNKVRVEENKFVEGIIDTMGGGIFNDNSVLFITDSTITGNNAMYGGGVYNGGSIVVQNSLLQGNTAYQTGGGLDNAFLPTATGERAIITNTTLSGNKANIYGSAIATTTGVLELTHVTMKDNKPSAVGEPSSIVGLFLFTGATVKMRNTLLANNGTNCFLSEDTSLNSLGYNLEDTDTCNIHGTGDKYNVPPGISGALADNGGPTLTYALLAGSKAINAIPRLNCNLFDQRYKTRYEDTCDIGAFEYEGGDIVFTIFLPTTLR